MKFPKESKTDQEVFDDFAARIGEHFPDYLLVARNRGGRGYLRRCSNQDWTYGTLKRIVMEIEANVRRNEELSVEDPGGN